MQNSYDNIPIILKQRPNWVAWGIRGAPLKSPFNPESLLTGKFSPAKAGICGTWSSYQAAVECVRRGLAQGIGFEFDGNDIYGVDLDHMLDDIQETSGDIEDWLSLVGSYQKIDTLDRDTVMGLIESITVSERIKVNGKQTQELEIQYRFIGNLLTDAKEDIA